MLYLQAERDLWLLNIIMNEQYDNSTIYLVLGSNKDQEFHFYPISSKTFNNIDKIIVERKKLSLPKPKIVFYGQDPFLYFSIIKSVILRYRYDLSYEIISTGKYLTEKEVIFINQYNILISILFDGKYTDRIQKENLLENPVFYKLFFRIKNRRFLTSLNLYSSSYKDTIKYLKDKFPNAIVNFNSLKIDEFLLSTLYNFDINKYKKDLRIISKKVIFDIINNIYSSELQIFKNGLKKFCQELNNQIEFKKFIGMDSDGNAYPYNSQQDKPIILYLNKIDDRAEQISKKVNRIFYNECRYIIIKILQRKIALKK